MIYISDFSDEQLDLQKYNLNFLQW